MYRSLITPFFTFLLPLFAFTQTHNNYTIQGYIKEMGSMTPLVGATIYNLYDSTSTTSDSNGFYTLSTSKDSARLTVSYIGYQTSTQQAYFKQYSSLDFSLAVVNMLKEITVESANNHQLLERIQMSTERIVAKEVKQIAALMGEMDIIKLLQLKPGVQAGIEGGSGIYVRGGSKDQNLFLLDGATLYNPSHLLGLFSTFNPDALQDVQLYKGSFPTRFGGRLSSVLDIKLRNGDKQTYKISGGLGILAARFLVEGPIVKEKSSFLVGVRSSYAHPFLKALNDNNNNPNWTALPEYHFYDANIKTTAELGTQDRLFVQAYTGSDVFTYHFIQDFFNLKFNLQWENQAVSARWNKQINSNAFLNTSIAYSRYQNKILTTYSIFSLSLSSSIQDIQLKSDFTQKLGHKHLIRAGAAGAFHHFMVGQLSIKSSKKTELTQRSFILAGEWTIYASDEWRISPKLATAFGVRWTNFHTGDKWYPSFAPRWNLRFLPSSNIAIKLSVARNYQFTHLVSPSNSTLPTDLWYPSTKNIAPQYADIIAASMSFSLGKSYYINIEGYYKWLYQQISFKDGARIFINQRLEDEFITGCGRSYGGEVYLEKKAGSLRGWISYTLAWNWRQFHATNQGHPFHPSNDQRHNLSVVLIWDLPFTGPKFPITLNATWVYNSGKATTLPKSRYIQTDIVGTNLFQFIPIYRERGNYRLPDYHRLDLGLTWKLFPLRKKRFKSELSIGVYNVYDRRNAFFMYINAVYSKNRNGSLSAFPDRLEGRTISLFPILPSITWNFRW